MWVTSRVGGWRLVTVLQAEHRNGSQLLITFALSSPSLLRYDDW